MLLLSVSLCGDPWPPTVPGLERILRGYNVYMAASLSDKGYDPSFHGNLIFKFFDTQGIHFVVVVIRQQHRHHEEVLPLSRA